MCFNDFEEREEKRDSPAIRPNLNSPLSRRHDEALFGIIGRRGAIVIELAAYNERVKEIVLMRVMVTAGSRLLIEWFLGWD